MAAADLLGPGGATWLRSAGHQGDWADTPDRYGEGLPYEVRGMLRSRANTIEGGTTEINKNVIAERVLGLPREPDPWRHASWKEVPRN